jgi:integrase
LRRPVTPRVRRSSTGGTGCWQIQGISLHSYRYAWAARAKACGYPERWAQNALGHNSPAVHQAYAKHGIAECPPLDEYEQAARAKVIPLSALLAGQPAAAQSCP